MPHKNTLLPEVQSHVGKEALLDLKDGLIVRVRILEARVTFGHPTYTITPVAGSGQTRVRSDLTVLTEEQAQ
jgi:hypothetical protein